MLHAQASPTASRAADLKIGGGLTTAASDYGNRFNGGMAYFDYDFTHTSESKASFILSRTEARNESL